jgi:uncharacterized membrane protein YcjF (UPF0283 family)
MFASVRSVLSAVAECPEGVIVGDRHRDPSDHFRTTQPHAGITMKDNLFWPGFILLAVAFFGLISTSAVVAYHHDEWLAATGLISVLGIVAGTLWLVVERRRVLRIDEQWRATHPDSRERRPVP